MGASGARMSRSSCRWRLGERSVGAAFVHVVGPGYLAYILGGGLYPAGLADLIAGVVDRYTGVRLAVPVFVQLKGQRARLGCASGWTSGRVEARPWARAL